MANFGFPIPGFGNLQSQENQINPYAGADFSQPVMANDMMGNGMMGNGRMGSGMMGNGIMGNGMMGSSMMRNSMMAYAMKAMDQDMSVNDDPEVRKMKVELEKKKLQANMSLYDTMQPQQQQPPPQQPPGNSIGQNVISGNQGGNITINYNGNTGAVNQTTNVAPAKPNA